MFSDIQTIKRSSCLIVFRVFVLLYEEKVHVQVLPRQMTAITFNPNTFHRGSGEGANKGGRKGEWRKSVLVRAGGPNPGPSAS